MKNLSKWLTTPRIVLTLEGDSFDTWVNGLVQELTTRSELTQDQARQLSQAVLSREALASTAVGRGVAIPHAYLEAISEPLVFFARAQPPLEHNAPDGVPVDLMFLLTGPPDAQSKHLKSLAKIVRLVHHQQMLDRLRLAENPEAVLEAIGEAERHHG